MAQEALELRHELIGLSKDALVDRLLALEAKRHGEYDDAKFEYVCQQIMSGRSARSVFRNDAEGDKENSPARSTFYHWLSKKDLQDVFDVKNRYEFALLVSMHDMNDEIIEIADDGSNDWMEKHNKDGEFIGWMENGESARRSKLRVDARERMIARMAPKKFGKVLDASELKNTTVQDRVIRIHDVQADDVPGINDE